MLLIFIITIFDLLFSKIETRLFMLALNHKIIVKRQIAAEKRTKSGFCFCKSFLQKKKTSGGSGIWFNGK